jgi:hypothetical protein
MPGADCEIRSDCKGFIFPENKKDILSKAFLWVVDKVILTCS